MTRLLNPNVGDLVLIEGYMMVVAIKKPNLAWSPGEAGMFSPLTLYTVLSVEGPEFTAANSDNGTVIWRGHRRSIVEVIPNPDATVGSWLCPTFHLGQPHVVGVCKVRRKDGWALHARITMRRRQYDRRQG